MKFLSFLVVKCHFISLLASPVPQQNDEYYYEGYEYEDYDYQDVAKMCILPPELDNVGEDLSRFITCSKVLIGVVMFDFFLILGTIMPIFECKTLHRFDKPPCNIDNFNGNHIDVSIYG